MNYTTYFYCDCSFEKAVTEGEAFEAKQCKNCFSLESIKKATTYFTQCQACSDTKEIKEGTSFENEKTCDSCGLTGEVGFIEFNKQVLFSVTVKEKEESSCTRCKKSEWLSQEKEAFTCPMCYKKLKQKMSSAWKE